MPTNVSIAARRTVRPASSRGAPIAVGNLCDRARRGDRHAWRELVDEFSGLVWSITRAHRLSNDDAADVAQATFLRFIENLHRLRAPEHAGAWLATTARRQCLAVLRQHARVVPDGLELPDAADERIPDHDAALIATERDEGLWRAFEALPDRDRSLLRLLMTERSPSYREISAALDIPVGSIGPTRARALERLRRCAQDLGVLEALHDCAA